MRDLDAVLLTGTRAPATVDLARRLWREGVRVVGADSMRYPLGRFSRAMAAHHRIPAAARNRPGFLRALATIARREGVSLVWPTCEEALHVSRGKAELEQVVPVFAPDPDVMEVLHHKLRFARWARELGTSVSAPESWPGPEAPVGPPLIWKPCYSRFATRTRRTPPASRHGWMAQRFVEGRELSAWALAVEGEVRIMTQYTNAARAGRGAGCAFDPVWSAEVEDFARHVCAVTRYTGAVAFDFIESRQGPTYVIECNPRMTSGMHVLDPDESVVGGLQGRGPAVPPRQRSAQLLLPTLAASPRAALQGHRPNVLPSRDDPRPGWLQGISLGEFAWRACTRRISLVEATTVDIAYDGR